LNSNIYKLSADCQAFWVSECYSFHDVSDATLISNNQKQQFLSHMAKGHEDWQVMQADTAIREK